MFNKLRKFSTPVRLLIFVPLMLVTLILCMLAFALADKFLGFSSSFGLSAVVATAISVAAGFIWVAGLRGFATMRKLSNTDALSGLGNRRAFQLILGDALSESQEVALALIDLDGFKQVNDFYGHAVGDQLITVVSAKLQEICGDEAAAFRLGGDEFALYMAGPLSGTILEGMGRKFIQSLSHPIMMGDRRVVVGASIGLASSKGAKDITPSELLRRADISMYEAKRNGKMRCVWHRPAFDQDLDMRRQLDLALHSAMGNDEFHVVYQPIVDIRNGDVAAFEALLRWRKGGIEPVEPEVFIPAAESSGLIHEIGHFALEQACKDATEWGGLEFSVNISGAQLRNPDFPRELGEILETTGIDPNRVTLDIAETSFMADPIAISQVLAIVRGFGVKIALDDFGTGYASIGFLRKFQFEKLKLDHSLVVAAVEDERARAMTVSIISMAHSLGMTVIAEGVENTAQADLMQLAGCDQAQGWLYYSAMPHAGVSALLSDATDPVKRAAYTNLRKGIS